MTGSGIGSLEVEFTKSKWMRLRRIHDDKKTPPLLEEAAFE
jgi:hypothetical protein